MISRGWSKKNDPPQDNQTTMGRSPSPGKKQARSPSKPSPAPPNVSHPKLYLRLKAKIRARLKPHQRWGAYHSGMLVQAYKRAGGTYREARPLRSSSRPRGNLERWYREKWVDVCAWPARRPCGRASSARGPFPYCRPSVRVSARTPRTVQQLSTEERKRRCAAKRRSPSRRIVGRR